MAHPDHIEPLDGFDRLTIRGYRLGLVLSAIGLGAAGLAALGYGSTAHAAVVLLVGISLSVGNLHLYDKRVRWVVQWLGWGGFLLTAVGVLEPLPRAIDTLAYGLFLAALSALVLKEWFCFRIPLVRWTPLVLAAAVVLAYLGLVVPAAVAHLLGALGVAAVAVAKLRMPLTHDLGDRRHYQV